MGVPSMLTVPLVGSMSLDRHRIRVDFPDPDSPMTTNVSPRSTEKDASRTATRHPVRSCTSWRLAASATRVSAAAMSLPKIFVTRLQTSGAPSATLPDGPSACSATISAYYAFAMPCDG